MAEVNDEVLTGWDKGARRRVEKTKQTILRKAAEMEGSGELLDISLVDFCRAAGVSHNSVRKHFGGLDGVIEALVTQWEAEDRAVSAPLRHAAARHRDHRPRSSEYAENIYRRLQQLDDRDLEGTRRIYVEVASTDEHRAVASACCFLAYRYLNYASTRKSVMDEAITYADWGLKRVASTPGRRPHALGAQLARIGAEAARRASRIVGAEVGTGTVGSVDPPTERDVLLATDEERKYLTKVVRFKEQERHHTEKLDLPVLTAAAQFHRDRALALIGDDRQAEIDSITTMARTLVSLTEQNHPVHPSMLVALLVRLCAAQLAYTDFHLDHNDELTGLRHALLHTLSQRSSTEGRAMTTMFALTDRDDAHGEIHPPDLSLVTTYSLVGKLLVADYLRDVAYAKAREHPSSSRTPPAVTAPEKIIFPGLTSVADLSVRQLFAAALMYYAEAPQNTLVIGAARILADRARHSYTQLVSDPHVGRPIPEEWPIFHNGELDPTQINYLSLGVVTGQRPSPAQARMLLRELEPALTVLRAIAMKDAKAREYFTNEDVALPELRFY